MQSPPYPANELERLQALDSYQILDTVAEPAFDALTQLVAHLLGVPIALVSLVDDRRQWFKSHYGLAVWETPRDVSFCAHVVALEQPLIVADATLDARFADNPLVTEEPGIRFYAGFPLRSSDGLVLGSLCAIDRQPRDPKPHELRLLELLARQTADQLELRRTARLAVSRQQRLNSVLETAVDAIITIDESGRIEQVNPATERLFGYTAGELVGENVRMLMPATLRQEHERGLQAYLRTGQRKVIGNVREMVGLRKDGVTFPLEAMVSEMRLENGRMFTGIMRDATQRKQTETRLSETRSDLERSRDDLLQVLNQLRIGTLVLAADRTVVFANETGLQLCGREAGACIGRSWEEVMDVGDSHRQSIRAMKKIPERERTRLEVCLGVTRDRQKWVEIDLRDDPRDSERQLFYLYDTTELHEIRQRLSRQRGEQIIGESAPMQTLYRLIGRIAEEDSNVLIEGETGVGKELVARAIHASSPRHDAPFIALNCAGLTESLLGSQLFGHIKGSFTGAVSNQQGFFEAASGGTLFLDEIGEIPMPLQSALLRALQEKEIVRIGETQPRKVNTRIIAATNRDLGRRVTSGEFRNDLLYRIRSTRVKVPALRERREDIPLLVAALLGQRRLTSGRPAMEISAAAMQRLSGYDWPGNVRELHAAIEHGIVHCQSSRIEPADLPPELHDVPATTGELPGNVDLRACIVEALDRAGGNRVRAARLLGISRATLYRRLKEIGVELPGSP